MAAKKPPHPNSLANLVPFTKANARENQAKGAAAKRMKADRLSIIENNLDAVLDLLDANLSEEEYKKMLDKLPNKFIRVFAQDFEDPVRARAAINDILDRIKGRPKQEVEAAVTGEMNFKFKFGDEQ